jgi:putative membrane protein
VVVGVDRYRNLGHALTDRYVLSRKGSLERETLTLKRDAIIGWKMDRSLFQRRAGLMTLVATIAAGHGSYAITDMDESDALNLADAAIPDLLTPFLEHVG